MKTVILLDIVSVEKDGQELYKVPSVEVFLGNICHITSPVASMPDLRFLHMLDGSSIQINHKHYEQIQQGLK